MKSNSHLLVVEYNGKLRPLAELKDHLRQVLLVFLVPGGEHLTLHQPRRAEEQPTVTYWKKGKPHSVHDDEHVKIARCMGYADPEKHRDYVVNRPLAPLNEVGVPIISRRFDVEALGEGSLAKRRSIAQVKVLVREPRFWLSVFFFPQPQFSQQQEIPAVQRITINTTLGSLVLEFRSNSQLNERRVNK